MLQFCWLACPSCKEGHLTWNSLEQSERQVDYAALSRIPFTLRFPLEVFHSGDKEGTPQSTMPAWLLQIERLAFPRLLKGGTPPDGIAMPSIMSSPAGKGALSNLQSGV